MASGTLGVPQQYLHHYSHHHLQHNSIWYHSNISSFCSKYYNWLQNSTTDGQGYRNFRNSENVSPFHPNICNREFSVLFSIHLLGCWQGKFVFHHSRSSLVGDHSLCSRDLHIWFRSDIIWRNQMFVTLRGLRNTQNLPSQPCSFLW